MDRSWAILNLLEEQSNENHISIKYSPKKKARVFVVICQATINNTRQGVGTSAISGFYGCVSKNEILWQIFSSKLEVIDQKSSKVPLRKWYKRPAISAETRAKEENLELDRLLSFIAAR